MKGEEKKDTLALYHFLSTLSYMHTVPLQEVFKAFTFSKQNNREKIFKTASLL